MNPLDTDQLRTFLAVERSLSFTRAADAVAKTQSAVSMQIKKLEDTVGKPLFLRHGRSIELTGDGRKLVPYAREIIDASTRALAAFDDASLQGFVRLGITDDYCERFLPSILGEFSRTNPLVEAEVFCGPTSQIKTLVDSGKIDVALVTHNEAGTSSQLVRKEPLLWVTGQDVSPHKLDPLPVAFGAPGCTWRLQAISAMEKQGRNFRIAYTSRSFTVTLSAVMSGLTVSVFPESALRPGIRVLREDEGFPELMDCEIGILRGLEGNNPLIDALISHIRKSLDMVTSRAQGLNRLPVDVDTIGRPPKISGTRLRPGHMLHGW
ncbi:MAG: LysR substrate-binding domain-containing protein [Pseudomonadota bacterium]